MFFKADTLKSLKKQIDDFISKIEFGHSLILIMTSDLFTNINKDQEKDFDVSFYLYLYVWWLISLGIIKDKGLVTEINEYYLQKFDYLLIKKGISKNLTNSFINRYNSIRPDYEEPKEALKHVFAEWNTSLINNIKHKDLIEVFLSFVEKSAIELGVNILVEAIKVGGRTDLIKKNNKEDQSITLSDKFNEYIANNNRINSKRIYNKLDTNEKKGDLEASQIDQIEIEAENNEKLDVLEKSLLEKISYNIALVLIWLDSLPEDKVIINAHKMVLRKNSIRYIEENNIGVSAFKEIKERSNYYKLLLLSQVMLEVEYAPSLQDEVLIKINNNEFNNIESLDSNEITKMVNNLTSNLYNKTIKIDNIDLNINEW